MTPNSRRRPRNGIASAILALTLVANGAGCTRHQGGAPEAEFVLAAGDSTYWVRNVNGTLQMRGSPMVLARVQGRFRELYVVDDDRSFESALFVGQRLYQRDLVTNDSGIVFQDTIVTALATRFERANPEARPLAPDEDPVGEPAASASAELTVLGVHGPFLSLEYHVDTTGVGDDSWHMTRHVVVDLRTGAEATLAGVLGDSAAATVIGSGRRAYREALDSVRADRRPAARRAARILDRFQFDPRSFALAAPNGSLMVVFSAPGAGTGGEGYALPMRPLPVPEPDWWPEARRDFPTTAREREEVWARGGYDVRAAYDSVAESVRLAVVDSGGGAFQLGTITAPVHRIYWLDEPALTSTERAALTRAFDEAALYDESARTVRSGAAIGSSMLLARSP